MPKLGGQLYQIDRPLTSAGRSVWQTQIMLVFVPLLIVFGFCSFYIQLQIHHQAAISKAAHQQTAKDVGQHRLSDPSLTSQSTLPVMAGDTDISHESASDQQTTTPQSSTSTHYLQSGDDDYWTDHLSVSSDNTHYTLYQSDKHGSSDDSQGSDRHHSHDD